MATAYRWTGNQWEVEINGQWWPLVVANPELNAWFLANNVEAVWVDENGLIAQVRIEGEWKDFPGREAGTPLQAEEARTGPGGTGPPMPASKPEWWPEGWEYPPMKWVRVGTDKLGRPIEKRVPDPATYARFSAQALAWAKMKASQEQAKADAEAAKQVGLPAAGKGFHWQFTGTDPNDPLHYTRVEDGYRLEYQPSVWDEDSQTYLEPRWVMVPVEAEPGEPPAQGQIYTDYREAEAALAEAGPEWTIGNIDGRYILQYVGPQREAEAPRVAEIVRGEDVGGPPGSWFIRQPSGALKEWTPPEDTQAALVERARQRRQAQRQFEAQQAWEREKWEAAQETPQAMLNQAVARAILAGDTRRAIQLHDLMNLPTPYQRQRLALDAWQLGLQTLGKALDIQNSPGDWWTYMRMIRGDQPNVDFQLGAQAIPRTFLEGFTQQFAQRFMGLPFQRQGAAPPRAGQFLAPAAVQPREWSPETEERVRFAARQAAGLPTTVSPITGETEPFRGSLQKVSPPFPTVAEPAKGSEEWLQRHFYELGEGVRVTPPGPEGLTEEQLAEMPSPRDEVEAAKKAAGQPYISAAGTTFVPTRSFQTRAQAEAERREEMRRERALQGPPLAATVPFQVTPQAATWQGRPGPLDWLPEQGLRQAFAGQVVSPARQMPAVGAPPFPSEQSWRKLLPSERQMFGAEIKRQDFYSPDYLEQWQATMSRWRKRRPFRRQAIGLFGGTR